MYDVAELIHRRLRGIKDSAVLALVVGGGAMRGAIAGGMLTTLEEKGASDIFDHIYCASAGATTGAIFLAGQCRLLLPRFLDRLSSKQFIRMTARGLYVDIPLVYQQLLRYEAPLNTARILAHMTMLHVARTDVDTGACHWYTNREHGDLLMALQASAAMPAFYNIPVVMGLRRYLDGGIAEPFSVEQAVQDGATHILALSTVPEHYRSVNRHPFIERWARMKTRKFGEPLARAYREHQMRFNRSLDSAFGRVPLSRRAALLTVAPRTLIRWSERRKRILRQAVEEGRREMRKALVT